MSKENRPSSWSLLEQALKEATEIKTPELTIDLPHNQKLTIGSLKPNTIVEIATWRGTGAPDENSVRMLLGASLQNGEEMAASNQPEQIVEEKVFEDQALKEIMVPETQKQEKVAAPAELPPLGGPSTPNAWDMVQELERERKQELQTEFQKEMGRKQMRKMTSKKSLRFRLLAIFGPLISISLIIGGLNISGILAFDHAQAGPELPFGSATSSIVAIVPNSEAAVGDFAMATINGERNLVRVDQVGAGSYTVATMAGPTVITTDQLDGKMSFIIPFIGFFWTLVGQ